LGYSERSIGEAWKMKQKERGFPLSLLQLNRSEYSLQATLLLPSWFRVLFGLYKIRILRKPCSSLPLLRSADMWSAQGRTRTGSTPTFFYVYGRGIPCFSASPFCIPLLFTLYPDRIVLQEAFQTAGPLFRKSKYILPSSETFRTSDICRGNP